MINLLLLILVLNNCHLNNPIQLVFKEVISLFNILQLIAVGDQRGGIDFACFDEGKDLGAVAAVNAVHSERL